MSAGIPCSFLTLWQLVAGETLEDEVFMKFFPHSSENGFSLVELVVALLITALVILGGAMFFYGRVNIIRETHRQAGLCLVSQTLGGPRAWNG